MYRIPPHPSPSDRPPIWGPAPKLFWLLRAGGLGSGVWLVVPGIPYLVSSFRPDAVSQQFPFNSPPPHTIGPTAPSCLLTRSLGSLHFETFRSSLHSSLQPSDSPLEHPKVPTLDFVPVLVLEFFDLGQHSHSLLLLKFPASTRRATLLIFEHRISQLYVFFCLPLSWCAACCVLRVCCCVLRPAFKASSSQHPARASSVTSVTSAQCLAGVGGMSGCHTHTIPEPERSSPLAMFRYSGNP